VNQVFEILVHWVEMRDWLKAFNAVIPKRKFQGSESCAEVQEDGGESGGEGEEVMLDERKVLEEGDGENESRYNPLDEVRKAPQSEGEKETSGESEALNEQSATDTSLGQMSSKRARCGDDSIEL
jgi:hypothetical protein